jgi:hypothetical protein
MKLNQQVSSSLNTPQPEPGAGEGAEVWPTITENTNLALPEWLAVDMRERNRIGTAKYGTPLRVWNGRHPVIDAYQEALDLIVYVQQARARLGNYSLLDRGTSSAHNVLALTFHQALQAARHLGELARLGTVPLTPPPARGGR